MAQIILDSANNLIQGDFDTATLSLRTRMQTSTTNATTGVYVVPNGSATSASVQVSNAADPTNASKVVVATNASTDTQIVSGANGSGSYLPLSFYTNNDIRFQMGNAGELNVRTAPGTVSSGTSGQFLTSGGPGAGVSWTTAAAGGFSNMTVFASPGTFTTPSTTTKIRVTVVGGGGGGGGTNIPGGPTSASGGGGGGGGAAIKIFSVSASTPYTVTVGAGGSAGSGLTSGTGGTSSFGPVSGTTISATGGTGGSTGPGVNEGVSGASGGAGSNGDVNITGGGGVATGGAPSGSGAGGSSPMGGGGSGIFVANPGISAGNNGGGYGGGASSAVKRGNPGQVSGGTGGGGVVIVEY
jgi:hypothetical protein